MKRPALVLLSLGVVLTLAFGSAMDRAETPRTAAPTEKPAGLQLAVGEQEPHAQEPHAPLLDGSVFVAYYGTVGTPVLGVLGESAPEQAIARVTEAAAPFVREGRPARPVFELIVAIADAYPGPDGDYSHDVPAAEVRRWVEAARAGGALLVLDIQTGLTDFTTAAKRWEWALREPHVGLAIDPEWRMQPGQVPGRVIGSTTVAEMNQTSQWLDELVAAHDLPEKLFVVHQFRTDMIRGPEEWADRPHLVEIQHVDGFGAPDAKLATYAAVARPDRFRMGFKLFYDEDVPRMTPEQVMQIQPPVDFVSFQ